jgi:hypothetical protein
MPHVTLRLEVDPHTRRRVILVSYASDPDALPHEHEEEHRALVEKLVQGGLISAEEAGLVQIERPAVVEVPAREVVEEPAERKTEERKAGENGA